MLDPGNPQIAPHLGRIRLLKARASDQTKMQNEQMAKTIGAMARELESNRIYMPSKYWETHGAFHVALLAKYGIENFKRTVSHDYQNWHMISRDDPQVDRLFRMWPDHFAIEPWINPMETPDHVGYHLSMSFNNPTNTLAFVEQREIYRVSVGLLWEYVNGTDAAAFCRNWKSRRSETPIASGAKAVSFPPISRTRCASGAC